jgi:hypothetical protein
MANALKVIDMVAKEALRIAHEKCSFIGTVYRGYDDSYSKKGAKIGDTLRIRNPNQYTRRSGSRIMSVQDQNEATQNLAVATQDGVDMKFNSTELSLSIDELSQRYIEPAMSVLCSGIEGDFISAMTKATYNTVGSAGTVPGASSDVTVLGNARAKLNQFLAPKDGNRALMLDSVTMASIVNAYKLAFQDTSQVKEAFREGFINRNAMADWYENDRTAVVTNGSDVTGTTDAASLVTDGGTTVDMHTTVAVSAQVVGEVFTIAGVYACHPETKAAYNYLQQFTITAIGASSTTVSPTIYLGLSGTTAAKRNVCKSDGTALALTDFNSQTLTFVGSASTAYRYGLMYHKEAFAFATADLPLMDDAIKCVRVNQDGLALRVWQGSDIRNDEMLLRIDILYGWLAQRPEWATRIICN